MARTSTILLNTTVGQTNPLGDKVAGSAYYGNTTGNHTIAVYNTNLTGRLIIEASLAADPTPTDWFEVDIDINSLNNYIEYTASTGVFFFNFKGNYVWLRAKVDRTYLVTPSDPAHGYISKILLNF